MRSVYHVALAVACPVAPKRPDPFSGVRDEFRPVYLFPFGDNAASLARRGLRCVPNRPSPFKSLIQLVLSVSCSLKNLIYPLVQQLHIRHQRGAKDRSHEKPIRSSARPDGAIGCRVCVCDVEESLALGT